MKTEIAMLILQALLKYGPAVARELVKIFTKTEITTADWEAVFAKSDKPFDAYLHAEPKAGA